MISIYGLTTTALITANFISITAFNIKSAPGITDLEGGVLYAKNLRYFTANLCNIYDVALEKGSGEAFFLSNIVGPLLDVTLTNNNFTSLLSPISLTDKVLFLTSPTVSEY